MSTLVRVSESFTIRKICPAEVNKNFFDGYYDDRTLPQYKIKTSTTLGNIGKQIGRNTKSEIYRFTDKSNNNQTIVTTNHSLYDRDELNPPLLRCKYCKRRMNGNSVGIPVHMTKEEDAVSFGVIDPCCDFGCAFSHLKRRMGESRLYRGPLYMNAEQMLYCMFYRMYPDKMGESIQEKPDWDLLIENGGPLSDEEFDSEVCEYVPIPSLVTYPCKTQYMKMNLKNIR